MKRKTDVSLGVAQSTPSVPIPPPELLARAKKLGAVSAGPANFSMTFTSAALGPERKISARKKKAAPRKKR